MNKQKSLLAIFSSLMMASSAQPTPAATSAKTNAAVIDTAIFGGG